MQQTYICVTDGTTVARRAFTHKHVEAIQAGASVSTGVGQTLVNLCFTPARQTNHIRTGHEHTVQTFKATLTFLKTFSNFQSSVSRPFILSYSTNNSKSPTVCIADSFALLVQVLTFSVSEKTGFRILMQ